MIASAADLVARLDLETIEVDIFRGRSPQKGWKRVFGGQVIAQALVAASRTVEGRAPHSLHAYFILPGDPLIPIVFEVDRIRDGRSFTTRRVVAVQRGKAIFSLSASFQIDEQGVEHSLPMPAAPDPDTLPGPLDLLRSVGEAAQQRLQAFFDRIRPIEVRPIDLSRYAPGARGRPREPKQSLWIRISGRLPDDPAVHRAALAFLSDMTLLDTALATHGFSVSDPEFQVAKSRSRPVVPSPMPRRRVAALCSGQPQQRRLARPDARHALFASGLVGRQRRPGRTGPTTTGEPRFLINSQAPIL